VAVKKSAAIDIAEFKKKLVRMERKAGHLKEESLRLHRDVEQTHGKVVELRAKIKAIKEPASPMVSPPLKRSGKL
jgi:phage shock protein A